MDEANKAEKKVWDWSIMGRVLFALWSGKNGGKREVEKSYNVTEWNYCQQTDGYEVLMRNTKHAKMIEAAFD